MSTVTGPTPDTTPDHDTSTRVPDTGRSTPDTTSVTPTDARPRRRWVAVVAGLALTAVAVTLGVVAGTTVGPSDTPVAADVVDDEQAALERLVRLGYVPREALQPASGEDAATERLQRLGQVPTGPAVPTLSSAARERATTAYLVRRGLVPPETMQPTTERGHTQWLVVQGLVPDGS